MVVIIVVSMTVAAGGIGTGLRIKWRFDRLDMAAKALDHRLDDVIGADADAIAEQLNRQMAIAEMPGDTHEFSFMVGMNFKQRLGLRSDTDHTASVRGKTVAVPQTNRFRQIDQHLGSGYRRQDDAAAKTTVVVDQNLIDFSFRIPGSCRHDGTDLNHGGLFNASL